MVVCFYYIRNDLYVGKWECETFKIKENKRELDPNDNVLTYLHHSDFWVCFFCVSVLSFSCDS